MGRCNADLERQRQAESLPANQRRTQLTYDKAWTYLSKGVCPGCERAVDLKDGVTDYCPHCGIGLFEKCPACQARTSSFAKFLLPLWRCGLRTCCAGTGSTSGICRSINRSGGRTYFLGFQCFSVENHC